MSAEEVLRQIEREGIEDEHFIHHFLSNLFLLFDNHLPPAIEQYVKEILVLIDEESSVADSRFRNAA